ncbi:MAG: EAL domain-containing protein [Lachnospiraceae bacterium]|nr:EAL domain-containing protein [Lachnospiraceae bacterium]
MSRKKVIKTVRKNHIWPTLVLCLFIALVVDIFIAFFASSFATYIVDTKIVDEYESVAYMAKIYDKNSVEEGENIYNLLDEDGRVYFICDKHGKVIHQNGSNTIGTTNGTVELPGTGDVLSDGETKARIYLDKTIEGFFSTDDEGNIIFDPKSLIKFANKVGEDSNLSADVPRSSIDLPLWVAIEVKGGTQVFYGKASFVISLSDVAFIVSFVLAGVVLVGCIIILMVVNMISTLLGQRRMSKVFFSDPVTRGRNWMWMSYRAEHILKKRINASQTFAVLDIVFVKYRNYCVCHSIREGEEMLCRVDKILRDSVNKKEVAAHYASANFALLLKVKDKDELEDRIKDILKKLESIDLEHKFSFHIGAYIILPEKDKNGRTVKRKDFDIEREYNNACTARTSLEECDDSGYAFFDENLVEEQKWINLVMDKYDEAIKNEEFVVYYQPKYDPKTNELKGVEALIRWNSPQLGFKPPATFIPILEKNGLIPEIDNYMITHVARDQKAWLDAGLDCVPASVNVSRAHFMEKDLAKQIRDIVDKEGAPHDLIEIELTESAFFDDKRAMIDTITQLKDLGFKVSMDDFGSGYSSLNSLKDMPLDILKLDAGFFGGDLNDNRGEIVVSEAIKLAKCLDMLTVAEGVEAKEQVDFLAKQGCDMIQGYYYAKPMPADKFALRMQKGFDVMADLEGRKAEEENAEEETAAETAPEATVENKTETSGENAPEAAVENKTETSGENAPEAETEEETAVESVPAAEAENKTEAESEPASETAEESANEKSSES